MLIFLPLLIVSLPSTQCARILAVLPIGAKSHHRFLQTVTRTLAQAGHEVVVYSPLPNFLGSPSANLTHVHIKTISIADQNQDIISFLQEVAKYPFYKCLDLYWTHAGKLYKEFIRDEEIKSLLTSGKQFDLLMTGTFSAQEYVLILSHIFKVPIIGLQAFSTNSVANYASGNAISISYIPDTCSSFSNKMSFLERTVNVFTIFRGLYYHHTYYIPKLENMLRNDIPDIEVPSLEGLTKSMSLMFVNDHLTADYAQPRPPNIIPVGGIHIEQPKPLPQNIQEFMDNAKNGVIYFSLGTYVADEQKPKEYFDMHINVFKKLKQKVLWKTRKTNIEGLPDSVMTVPWAPQKDILGHPACVLFITHGGQLSLLEAVHFGVPVVSISQFFDQHRNSEFYVRNGIGEKISSKDVSEETMTTAIRKVLGSSSYKENMKKLSAIFKDRPMSPAESVVFWTEYVLRHGGAGHLRPASTELRWYQTALLDVIGLVSLVLVSFSIMLYYTLKGLAYFVCNNIYIGDLFKWNVNRMKKLN